MQSIEAKDLTPSHTSLVSSSDGTRTSRKTYFGLRGASLHKMVAFVASVSFMLFGYDQGVMSSLLTLPSFLERFPEINATADKSKSTLQGLVVAIYEIGCMSGALFAMMYGDNFGRRKMIWAGAAIMTVGAVLQCSAFGLPHLIVGRIVTGIGNGFLTATIPMWLSECAKPERRGALNMISAALNIFGVALSYWVDFGFYFVKGSASWRFPIAFQIVFALFMMSVIFLMPESPRWLVKQQRIEEAKEVFAVFEEVDANDAMVLAKVKEIQDVSMKEENGFSLKTLISFGPNKHFHRTMLAAFCQIMQQICGINLITYYAGTIYEDYLNMDPIPARILAACNGTEYFFAACLSYFVIEKIGRRNLMMFCAAGQAGTMAILCGSAWGANQGNTSAAISAAVFLFVFNSFFAVGWLGVTWLYPAEIAPLEIRAAVNGLSTACNWAFTFLIVMITPICFAHIGSYTYAIFACVNFIMVPAVYIFYPETAGRSLEDIDVIFENSNPKTPWDVVNLSKRYTDLKFNALDDYYGKALVELKE